MIKAKGKDYVLECDECGAESPPFAMGTGSPATVLVEGWQHQDGESTCPACQAKARDEPAHADDEVEEDNV